MVLQWKVTAQPTGSRAEDVGEILHRRVTVCFFDNWCPLNSFITTPMTRDATRVTPLQMGKSWRNEPTKWPEFVLPTIAPPRDSERQPYWDLELQTLEILKFWNNCGREKSLFRNWAHSLAVRQCHLSPPCPVPNCKRWLKSMVFGRTRKPWSLSKH